MSMFSLRSNATSYVLSRGYNMQLSPIAKEMTTIRHHHMTSAPYAPLHQSLFAFKVGGVGVHIITERWEPSFITNDQDKAPDKRSSWCLAFLLGTLDQFVTWLCTQKCRSLPIGRIIARFIFLAFVGICTKSSRVAVKFIIVGWQPFLFKLRAMCNLPMAT